MTSSWCILDDEAVMCGCCICADRLLLEKDRVIESLTEKIDSLEEQLTQSQNESRIEYEKVCELRKTVNDMQEILNQNSPFIIQIDSSIPNNEIHLKVGSRVVGKIIDVGI